MALSFVNSQPSGVATFAEDFGSAKNLAAVFTQLRNFATVGLCNAQTAQNNLLLSQGMTLAVLCGLGKGESLMTVERYLRLIAGCFVLATLLLGYFHSPYWFLFTGFVAVNLIQSAFTNWCPMMSFLRWLGAKSNAAPVSSSSRA